MKTASQLKRNCAYPIVLDAKRKVTPEQQAAKDAGTSFHELVRMKLEHGADVSSENPEIQSWLDMFDVYWAEQKSARRPDVVVECEVPWGLSPDGRYVEVTEPQPHIYVPVRDGDELLTAGRIDLVIRSPLLVLAIDYKTGKWPSPPADENLQANAAGLALTRKYGTQGYAAGIYSIRDGGPLDRGLPVVVNGAEWERRFEAVREAAQLPLTPIPGEHCASCWNRRDCPEGPTK